MQMMDIGALLAILASGSITLWRCAGSQLVNVTVVLGFKFELQLFDSKLKSGG